MKKIILLGWFLSISACLCAQNMDQRVSIVFRNLNLSEALTQLIDQKDIPLVFNNAAIPPKKINTTFRNYKLAAILDYLLLNTPLGYQVKEGAIIIEATQQDLRKKHYITGTIVARASGENLVGASVYLPALATGTYTNEYGQFSLELPEGDWQLYFSHIGHAEKMATLSLNRDTAFVLPLEDNLTINPITLWDTSNALDRLPIDWNLEKIDLRSQDLLPRFGGETDVFQTMHLLPGVQTGADGIGGIYVRGGNTGHNLITVDGVPVYNSTHAVGLLSIFNPDVIKTAKFLKGAYPARYEGRLASVLDIRTRDGNYNKLSGSTHLGLISARASLEGPLFNNQDQKSSFLVAGRWSILDQFLEPRVRSYKLGQGEEGSSTYDFYDFNAKLNYHFSPRSKLYLSFYKGKDDFNNFGQVQQRFRLINPNTNELLGFRANQEYDEYVNWGNDIFSLRWNKEVHPQLFASTTLTYSFLKLNFGYQTQDSLLGFTPEQLLQYELLAGLYQSSIRDVAMKVDFDWYAGLKHYVRFGVRSGFLDFSPGILQYNATNLESGLGGTQQNRNIQGRELALYAENSQQVLPKLRINYGIHLSSFFVDQRNYWLFQPRFSFDYQWHPRVSLFGSARKTSQFLHLLTSSTIGLPTDMWVPSTGDIHPESAVQYALGSEWRLNRQWSLELEAYYKGMDNLLSLSEGISFIDDWESNITAGRGTAYGIDLKLEKQSGKTSGWISYSYGFTNRNFERINFGETYPFKYDRRHDLKMALIHQINDHWSISGNFLFGSGLAYSLPSQSISFQFPGSNFPVSVLDFGSKNQYRLPYFHRLDLGLNYQFTKWKLRHHLYLGVTNLYNRSNPLYYRIRTSIRPSNGNLSEFRQFVGVQSLPLLPSINISSKF
ncbi:MAG TPA: carboxypeptidase-like regulatory domain-containing protein [Saprospiraceae bacterium]|nr:carboxypeptidase-like regulatory domain-containing protein [Saprospiraceae bacterium]